MRKQHLPMLIVQRHVIQNSNSRLDETTNYEVDRRIRHVKRPVGNIERLSVAVIVNYKTVEDKKKSNRR